MKRTSKQNPSNDSEAVDQRNIVNLKLSPLD